MPPAEFGLLASVLGIATVVQTLLDMGVSTFTTRERAADPDSGAVTTALRFNARTSIAMGALSALSLAILGVFVRPEFLYMLPLSIWISAERTADVRLTVSFADGDVRINVFNLVGRRILATAGFLALTASAIDGLLAYSIAVALAAFVSSLFAGSYVRRHVNAPPSISYRELIRASWPYWLHSVSTQLRNLDAAVTAVFAGATQAGYFSVASRLTSPLRILPTTLSSVLLPAAARSSGSKASLRSLTKLTLVALATSTLFFGVVVVIAPWAIGTFLDDTYAASTPAVIIVVLGLPFAAATSLFSSLLQGAGRKHFVATVSTASSLICLGLVVVGAISWGAIGAASALTLTFVLQAIAIAIGFLILVWRSREEPRDES